MSARSGFAFAGQHFNFSFSPITGLVQPHVRIAGLLFVGVSLHLDRETLEYEELQRVGAQTMIDLAYVLAFALLMLMPISNPTILGAVLLAL